MKERPILFSAPMVRALLAGAKTQTRRVFKAFCPARPEFNAETGKWEIFNGDEVVASYRCRYGQPGGRLWVRETWARNENQISANAVDSSIVYRADELGRALDNGAEKPWKPSIHMPRWASRIELELTGVRVERLQDISDSDAQAEGCLCYVCGNQLDGRGEDDCHCFHRKANASDYRDLWEAINGPGSWDANPWVWVLEFRKIRP